MTPHARSLKAPGDPVRRQLADLRQALLRLHKSLLETERKCYERVHGRIGPPGAFFQLLIHDTWFAWLHPLSELVVEIDETLDNERPATEGDAERFSEQARLLVKPSETGGGFPRHYYDALQRDPGVVLAHAAVIKLLAGKGKES